MQPVDYSKLRNYITERLRAKGDTAPFSDTDSLFISGRLDSLDAVETLVFLEKEFGIDFAELGFDQQMIDSLSAMQSMINPDN